MAGICDFADKLISTPIAGVEAGFVGAARQGTRFNKTITVPAGNVAVPLTGVGIRMQIRRHLGDDDAILTLAVGGYIVVTNAAGGVFEIDIPATVMATLPVSTPEGFYYDLKLIPAGVEADAFALLAGRFVILPKVTT